MRVRHRDHQEKRTRRVPNATQGRTGWRHGWTLGLDVQTTIPIMGTRHGTATLRTAYHDPAPCARNRDRLASGAPTEIPGPPVSSISARQISSGGARLRPSGNPWRPWAKHMRCRLGWIPRSSRGMTKRRPHSSFPRRRESMATVGRAHVMPFGLGRIKMPYSLDSRLRGNDDSTCRMRWPPLKAGNDEALLRQRSRSVSRTPPNAADLASVA